MNAINNQITVESVNEELKRQGCLEIVSYVDISELSLTEEEREHISRIEADISRYSLFKQPQTRRKLQVQYETLSGQRGCKRRRLVRSKTLIDAQWIAKVIIDDLQSQLPKSEQEAIRNHEIGQEKSFVMVMGLITCLLLLLIRSVSNYNPVSLSFFFQNATLFCQVLAVSYAMLAAYFLIFQHFARRVRFYIVVGVAFFWLLTMLISEFVAH